MKDIREEVKETLMTKIAGIRKAVNLVQESLLEIDGIEEYSVSIDPLKYSQEASHTLNNVYYLLSKCEQQMNELDSEWITNEQITQATGIEVKVDEL